MAATNKKLEAQAEQVVALEQLSQFSGQLEQNPVAEFPKVPVAQSPQVRVVPL